MKQLALALPHPEVRIVPLPPLGPHWALSGRRCPSAEPARMRRTLP